MCCSVDHSLPVVVVDASLLTQDLQNSFRVHIFLCFFSVLISYDMMIIQSVDVMITIISRKVPCNPGYVLSNRTQVFEEKVVIVVDFKVGIIVIAVFVTRISFLADIVRLIN